MMKLFPASMKPWRSSRCSQRSISWTLDMWMLRNSSEVCKTTGSIFLGQPEKIIIGKLVMARALRLPTLLSIGRRRVPPARQARPAAVGRPWQIGEATRSSKSNLPCRIVVPVLTVSTARTHCQPHPVGFSRCVPNRSIRLYKQHANGKPPRSSRRHTTNVLASKAPSRRVFVLSISGTHGIGGWRKFTSSMFLSPLLSMSVACLLGSRSNRVRKHGKRRSFVSSRSGLK